MTNNVSRLIEDYLLGHLPDTEARRVEERAQTDAEFAREIELQRSILEGIETYGDAAMQAKIAGIDRSLEDRGFFQSKNPGWGRLPLRPAVFRRAMAAGLLLLALACWWWSAHRKTVKVVPSPPDLSTPVASIPDQPPAAPPAGRPAGGAGTKSRPAPAPGPYLALARANWTPPDFSSVRTALPGTPDRLAQATRAFQQKDYPKVITLLAALAPDDPHYWPASEMYAHACFLAGQSNVAATRFNQLASSGQLPFSERAQWYLLLCYLSELPQKKPSFDALLNQMLSDPGHPYFENAQQLARQLRR